MDPVADNPLRTRDDFQRAVGQLFEPLSAHFSPGKARVRPMASGAHFPDVAAELEGFARPLWGIVPLGAQGEFDRWELFREGLVNGTDPSHEEYWGTAGDHSQKHVEMAAIGVGLALTPEHLWEPLSEVERDRLVAWLNQINDAELPDCNWLFFRVMVNVGLRSVGARHDWERTQDSLDRLESFYRGDGWYTDGPASDRSPVDYYLPWAMHFYGLVYATVAGEADPERAERFRARAETFASHHVHWFAEDGRALPYGRSLTYRFAQASFWGGLAFAGLDPLPWGVIRGLWARNVRWWLDQPIFTDGGLLSVGYRYPSIKMSEDYNSPNSPYWAMKAFFPLALSADHPFWQAAEEPLPDLPTRIVQPEAGKVICRADDHLFALSLPQDSTHGREKYTKFAYSTEFGFSVAGRSPGPGRAGHDSALALSLDGDQFKTPGSLTATEMEGTTVVSRWEPWNGVRVDSWVAPALPSHVRLHRLVSDRTIHTEEGGFALDRTGDDGTEFTHETGDGTALARYPNGMSAIASLGTDRSATVIDGEPNTNLHHSRTVVPTLRETYEPGEHWFGSAVRASPDREAAWERGMTAVPTEAGIAVETADGERLLDPSNGAE
ncbi:DUF2264 domain-containing protein [Halococcus hamelinensis]|uniref:DUF2264 domain-containing protein n=1 Tax=Halococcus hamelinensis 100A6 TaxID=1132509 RepID=M0M087_9EURY|nr:DUF2264 domain-containing protein [Halococcus hamelinensis]EMA38009.1 hypothetical protein C447_11250 [Halococcus hamelinensis 100A6]